MGLLATLTGWRLLRFLLRAVAVVLAVIVGYLAVTAVQVWLTGRRSEPRTADAVVVMGAAQYDGVPSPDLAARLDEAAALYRAGYAPVIVVTGSKEPGDTFTEAEASARYLEARGVPPAAVLQAGGRTSWENLATARPLLDARGARTVLVVTDPFHEDRSMAIASSLGFTPYPTPTRTSPITGWSTVPYYAKETAGVAVGRIVGYDHLAWMHDSVGTAVGAGTVGAGTVGAG